MTEDQKIASMKAIQERIPSGEMFCPLCKTNRWTVQGDGLIVHTVQRDYPIKMNVGGQTLPCLALICQNCGNTHFLNIFILGIAEIFGFDLKTKEAK